MDPKVKALLDKHKKAIQPDAVTVPGPKFNPGKVVATPGAIAIAEEYNSDPTGKSLLATLVHKHVRGNWGSCCKEDREANDDALKDGGRVMSVFESDDHETLWVITEWDRSVCTVLRPDEY